MRSTVCILTLILAAAACGAAERLPDKVRPSTVIVSPNGQRYAYIRRNAFGLVPVVDGTAQQTVDWIVNNSIQFSADSRHVFYVARSTRDAHVVLDGIAGPALEKIEDWIFSGAGRLMYLASRDNHEVVYVDGDQRAMLPQLRLGALADRPDAVAFVQVEDDRETVYRNNVAQKPYAGVKSVRFSPDGAHLGYRARQGGHWMIVVDGVERTSCDELAGPVFSADSQHVAWTGVRNGKAFVAVDGTETPLGEAGQLVDPVISADGSRTFAVVQRGGKSYAYIDGKPAGIFNAVGAARFSPDGRHLAFGEVDATGKSRVVADGAATEGGEYVYDLKYSPDSKHLGYVVTHSGTDTLYMDGKAVGTFDEVIAGTLGFSADGHYAAVVTRDRKQYVLIDGKLHGPFDAVISAHPIAIDGNTVRVLVTQDHNLTEKQFDMSR